jgi:hypothetical protein
MTTTAHPATSTPSPRMPVDPLRRTALIVGVLFLITYATSIASKFAFYRPMLDSADYVASAGNDALLQWGAVSEMVLVIANIGTAVFLFPVLKRVHEGLALGFVTARVIESVFICVGILSVLSVVTLRQTAAGAGEAESTALSAAGDALVALQEWTFQLGPGFVVGVGNGLILGYLMYRSGLVPRRLAMLGLVGGPLIVLTGTAVMLDVIEAGSAWQLVATIPEFFWELGLGIYLIVKGFKPSPITAGMADE